MAKSILDPSAGKKSIPARIRRFIQGPQDDAEDLIQKVRDGAITPRYQNSIWNWQSGANANGMGFASEIPNMLRDPVISSAVNLLMTTCFQLSPEQKIFWVKSKYAAVTEELEKFHTDILMQKRILDLGYNIVIWGNLPIKLIYDKNNVLSQLKFIGDYNKVVPIIISGKTIGHLVNGEYHYPLQYVFAQSQYNHDFGGPLGHGLIKLGNLSYGSAGGAVMNLSKGGVNGSPYGDTELEIENEFALAPSYVANAVRPWRNIKIIEDALLLARLDQSNYFRIFTVNVGPSVDSKSAIRVLNYYRSLFKKVRRVSYDSSGMSQQGGGAEFEVIIPKTNQQGGVDVTDVGGQKDIRALKDLDVQYQRLFASLNLQPSQIGFGQGQSSNINMGASPEEAWELRWMRTCKSTLFSVLDAVRQIDLYYLRSKGYRVSPSDWTYGTVLQGQIDDHERNDAMKTAALNLKTIAETLGQLQLADYNKKYLIKAVLGPSFESIGVNVEELMTPIMTGAQPPLLQQDYNLKLEELQQITSTVEQSGEFSEELVSSMKAFIESETPLNDKLLLSDLSYAPKQLAFKQLLSGAAYLSHPETELDLDTVFERYDSLPEGFVPYEGTDVVSSIDVDASFMIPKDFAPVTINETEYKVHVRHPNL